MEYRFSRQAERDIEDIGDYIARNNPNRAISFITELRNRCRHIAECPRAAAIRPGRYLIFYVMHARILEIRRVLHCARNISADDLH
jgi:toxin ParE1/3/4